MTEKMMLFCEEYLKDKELSDSAAYKRVYKTCKSDITARSNASKLLKRLDVREYIQKKQAEIHDKNTADIKEIEEYLTSVVRGKSKSEVLKLNGAVLRSLWKSTRKKKTVFERPNYLVNGTGCLKMAWP